MHGPTPRVFPCREALGKVFPWYPCLGFSPTLNHGRTETLMMSSISLDEEARLYTTNAEREKYESLATLFGIIVALDYLERAYVRDSVTAAEYVCL